MIEKKTVNIFCFLFNLIYKSCSSRFVEGKTNWIFLSLEICSFHGKLVLTSATYCVFELFLYANESTTLIHRAACNCQRTFSIASKLSNHHDDSSNSDGTEISI